TARSGTPMIEEGSDSSSSSGVARGQRNLDSRSLDLCRCRRAGVPRSRLGALAPSEGARLSLSHRGATKEWEVEQAVPEPRWAQVGAEGFFIPSGSAPTSTP